MEKKEEEAYERQQILSKIQGTDIAPAIMPTTSESAESGMRYLRGFCLNVRLYQSSEAVVCVDEGQETGDRNPKNKKQK